MLSVSPIKNASYYENLARDDYYQKGGEPAGKYAGAGAEALGLKGTLSDGDLGKMLEGFNPKTGKAVATNAGENKRAGQDMCFSAPKSVSTVWASTTDAGLRDSIQQAQQRSVEKAIGYLEQNAAFIRRGHGGHDHEPAKLICATYEHSTSREQDPQLHTHTLVAAHGVGAESDDVRSLENRYLYQFQKAAGAVYRAELANEMKNLGFQVEQVEVQDEKGKSHLSFQVAGSSKELEQEWSKRREDIKNKMSEKGVSGAKAAEIAALDTRNTKQTVDRAELFQRWQNEAQAHEFNPEHIRNAELEINQPEFDSKQILEQATEQEAVFTKAQLHCAVAQQLQGIGTAEDIQERIEQLEQDGELISLGVNSESNLQQFTSREMLELEKGIADFAEHNQDSTAHKLSEQSLQQALETTAEEKGYALSGEQENAFRHITREGQVSVIQGQAGTGKSTLLAAANKAFEAEEFKVQGLALASKAATGLQEGSGIQSQTIHSYLIESENGRKNLDSKSILVVDEAGMVDTKLLGKITRQAEQAGAKVILVGDSQQLQSIGAGGTFSTVSDRIGKAELTEIFRQDSAADKQSLQALRQGDSKAFLAHMKAEGRLSITKSTTDAHKQMSDKFIASKAGIQDKIMIAGRRADVSSLNKMARQQLKEQGKLSVESSFKDSTEKTMKVAIGDRLRILKNNKQLGVSNGDLATVSDINITDSGDTVLSVETDSGKQVEINTTDYNNLTHGYCITAHASQGATVKEAYIYSSSFNSKEMAYVQGSRHKEHSEIFASEQEVGELAEKQLERAMARSTEKQTALEKYEEMQAEEQENKTPLEQAQDNAKEAGKDLDFDVSNTDSLSRSDNDQQQQQQADHSPELPEQEPPQNEQSSELEQGGNQVEMEVELAM
ncbi:multifunctional conjugation protein TraI [Mariprofundus micogutta]|uniref:Multifunctional conjugation protein TraI n=1 Tax=Mariprofundus micogutta TaxID=1921010 RepID=A0A1L8CK68_9PROT|nr:MobF family relaxase [Mariprofundus micogutta]GAV19302.1 multifunctional conjugation protein TraI [Mariprofundus micogutta]